MRQIESKGVRKVLGVGGYLVLVAYGLWAYGAEIDAFSYGFLLALLLVGVHFWIHGATIEYPAAET